MAFIKEKGSTLGRDYLRVNRTATCSPFVSYQAAPGQCCASKSFMHWMRACTPSTVMAL